MTEENEKKNNYSRRTFLKSSAAAGAGILLSNSVLANFNSNSSSAKKRFAIVGMGSRSRMYQDAIYYTFADNCELVGFCDVNLGRLQYMQQRGLEATGVKIPIYDAKDFNKMVKEMKPDTIIVTTVDGFHHEYIIKALELGKDVITEKPMTIDDVKCQQIIDAQKRAGKKVTVGFNYRYSPPRTQVKEQLMNGVIGDILSVDFHWMLNTHHGADYFRRWHSQKDLSGGLMVHKATHHFDLINWWLSAVPVKVYALGKREYYTPEMAKRIGLDQYHERCHTCPEKEKCGFELDLSSNQTLKELYLDNEKYDGYFRDKCVFRPDIDIEDTMNVIVKYNTNTTLSYSLNAFNSWEGYYVIFNGTKGRLEHKIEEKMYINGMDTVQGAIKGDGTYIKIYPLRGAAYELDVWSGEGGHGGGDKILLEDLFLPEKREDKYYRSADQRSGAYSILTGVAANQSMATGKEIVIDDLVKNIGMPEYPAMPSPNAKLPMPVKDVKFKRD